MDRALLISKNIIVYIHRGAKPNMPYNKGKLVVSKSPNSPCVFCADSKDLAEF